MQHLNTAQEEYDAFVSKNSQIPRITRTSSDESSPSDNESGQSQSSYTGRSSSGSGSNNMAAVVASPNTTFRLPTTRFDANTGPKGVIADAQSFSRARKTSFRQTFFALSQGLVEKVNPTAGNSRTPSPGRRPRNGERRGSREKDDGSEGSEEDSFMQTWRMNRKAELEAKPSEVRTRRKSPSKRRFGKLARVDASGYLDAIERVTADTVVVVLVYDKRVSHTPNPLSFKTVMLTTSSQLSVSSIVEDALSNLARKHETTRFVKITADEAEMDIVAVPAILAYQAGELIANLVSVVDEIPDGRELSSVSLELLLRQRSVLQ